jgi:uncharacterized protein (DUF433 family)
MTLQETLIAEPLPLSIDKHGTVRVGGTRVTLETVISVYEQGETAEAIARYYPSLQLSDIQTVLRYYHQHREEVAAYLEEVRRKEDETIRLIDSRRKPGGVHEILEAHRERLHQD